MLYIDAPYGLRYATWDHKKFDSADYIRLFKQMAAMTDRDNWIAVVWSDHFSLPDVNKAMLEQNFKNTNNVFWYKFNQNQEGTHNLTNAVESGTVGFKDGRKSVPWYMSANPTERHNLAVGGTMRRLHKRANGTPVNVYQKPPYLSRSLVKSWLAPGSTVVVGGVGAGGDVEGLISAGMNVIGFENDLEQCKELISIWSKYESDFKEKGVLGWVDQEPVGTFGGMHYDSQSNLTTYKHFLQTRAAEMEAEEGGGGEIGDASSQSSTQKKQMCKCCGCDLAHDYERVCNQCRCPVCPSCWQDHCNNLRLPQGTAVFCEEAHRLVADHVPESQIEPSGTQPASQ